MNNMIEKALNDYKEDLQELNNIDLLFEYKFACVECEEFRQLAKTNPDNKYFQSRFEYEKQVRTICMEECLKRMRGNGYEKLSV